MDIKERQYYHRQAKSSAQAWARIARITDKVNTSEISSPAIIKAILDSHPQALLITRYDVETNDRDNPIYRFTWETKEIKKELNIPISLIYNDNSIMIHIINYQLGFISSRSEDISAKFLGSIIT